MALPHQVNLMQIQAAFEFTQAYTTETLPNPNRAYWFMDSGTTSLLSNNEGILHSTLKHNTDHSVIVGNGLILPDTSIGSSSLRTNARPLSLTQVLVTPNIVKNFTYVRKFTKDNWCSVEFDPFGFSVKDLQTRKTLLRCESNGDLYPLPASFNKTPPSTALFAASSSISHKRLGHTNDVAFRSILYANSTLYYKQSDPALCQSCVLGKQIKLSLFQSHTQVTKPFDIVHSDVWTSPIPRISGIQYFVLFLDHYSQFL